MTAWPTENKLAAPYHVSPAMTGFEELDLYGSWDTVPDCGAVWYPSSYHFGPLGGEKFRGGHAGQMPNEQQL